MTYTNKIPKDKITAKHNFVIVDMLDDNDKKNENITSAGIVLSTPKMDPTQLGNRISFARVVSVGDDCNSVFIDEVVGFLKIAASVIEFDTENRLYIIHENDIMVKVEE